MKPTLLVMAAGMGSRYGGLKQMDGFGPMGETLLDYAVYDAIRAGFGKVVFVIRPEMAEDFHERVSARFEQRIPVHFAFQTLEAAAGSFRNPERSKPWGTGHAVLVARDLINEPFAVINADDFYGADGLNQICTYLATHQDPSDYAMVAYRLRQTLSQHGHVSRGVCAVSAAGFLEQVSEHTKIFAEGEGARSRGEGRDEVLEGSTLVSMNLWGFQPSIFAALAQDFQAFLAESGQRNDSEFVLPGVVDRLLRGARAHVRVLSSPTRWLGVTYPSDRDIVVQGLAQHVAAGSYPASLWGATA